MTMKLLITLCTVLCVTLGYHIGADMDDCIPIHDHYHCTGMDYHGIQVIYTCKDRGVGCVIGHY